MSDAPLRAYLLGNLTESEVERVETRLIEDEDFFSQLETAEDDLFDAYARGVLTEEERTRFLERFGADIGRRRFARAIVQRTSAGNVVPFYRRRWVELAVAASLLAVVGTMVTRREPVVAPVASPAPAPVTAATPTPAPTSMHVALVLGTSRAAGAPVRIAIEHGATQIDLAVRINPADRFPIYAVTLRSRDNIVWGDAALKAVEENGDLVIHVIVPADRLPDRSYEVSVRGGTAAASLEDLGFLNIEVSRAQ